MFYLRGAYVYRRVYIRMRKAYACFISQYDGSIIRAVRALAHVCIICSHAISFFWCIYLINSTAVCFSTQN
jgi:hypothetical protein